MICGKAAAGKSTVASDAWRCADTILISEDVWLSEALAAPDSARSRLSPDNVSFAYAT